MSDGAAKRFEGLRIVFAADLNPYGRSWTRLRAFRELGAVVSEVSHTLPGDMTTGISSYRFQQKVAAKVGIAVDWANAGAQLLRAADQVQPQLIWIEKAMALRPSVLAKIKRRHPEAVLAWFSEDDMYAAHNRTARFDAGLADYDIVFTTKSYNADPSELPALGARKVVYVHQTHDPAQHHPLDLSAQDQAAFGGDLGFIGSYELERANSMLRLAEAGLAVRVWGNGWHRAPMQHPNLRLEQRPLVNNPPDQLNYTKGIQATAINLCFLRKMNRDLHTSRTFEIPAIGGFMLAERTPEHSALFREGVEAEFFASDEELVAKARHYLAHPEERLAIAAAGHKRCSAEYGSVDQAVRMLDHALPRPPR